MSAIEKLDQVIAWWEESDTNPSTAKLTIRGETLKEIRAELETLKVEAEGQKARADWLDGLFRKACTLLQISTNPEAGERLWTAYSTPPQFDKDGIAGFVDEKID